MDWHSARQRFSARSRQASWKTAPGANWSPAIHSPMPPVATMSLPLNCSEFSTRWVRVGRLVVVSMCSQLIRIRTVPWPAAYTAIAGML